MDEYIPIDLTAHHNAGVTLLGEQRTAPLGTQHFRGLPFLVGANPVQCFIAFGGELERAPLSIPLGERASSVIIAHRLLASGILAGGSVGEAVADYVFAYQSGEQARVTIRDRFEIAEIPTAWGQLPFLAVPDQHDSLPPRETGRFAEAGLRQTAVSEAAARGYYLWAWRNLRPEDPLTTLRIVPAGPPFLIAGVTLGWTEEYPFVRTGAQPLKITITDPAAAEKPFALAVTVDRGVATFPYSLPQRSSDEFLADAMAGWGEAPNEQSNPASVEIAALPSATVTVAHGDDVLATARWGEIEERTAVERPRARLQLLDTGRNWVHTRVIDDETGELVPCRVHFRSPDGLPFQPHGHQQRVNPDSGAWRWHGEVGADVRLGGISYAYIDGSCQGWLPRGEALVDVARGFEYEPLRT
jgi:hypothetical protein